MARRKEDNILAEAGASVKYLWRHRAGLYGLNHIKIFGRTLHIDNRIPALIEDTFANLGYEQKDGSKPVIAAKRRTKNGWHLVIHLPPGVSFGQVKRDREFFADATNSWVELEWKHGKCHMNIQAGELPENIHYEWTAPEKMYLPVPIGFSRSGLITLDLTEAPHMLIGGSTGGGKTNFLRCLVHSVIDRAIVVIIDPQIVDFYYLHNHAILATNEHEIAQVLTLLNQEHDRRIGILLRNQAVKVQECEGELPFIVVVVDELAEIKSQELMAMLDRLVRLSRKTGISIVAASQRTSVQVIPGDTRMNFLARVCFKVATEADSRVILGEDCGLAGQLPAIKGRAIYRFGLELHEVQTMNLPRAIAGELAATITSYGRDLIEQPETESKVKRLKPR